MRVSYDRIWTLLFLFLYFASNINPKVQFSDVYLFLETVFQFQKALKIASKRFLYYLFPENTQRHASVHYRRRHVDWMWLLDWVMNISSVKQNSAHTKIKRRNRCRTFSVHLISVNRIYVCFKKLPFQKHRRK